MITRRRFVAFGTVLTAVGATGGCLSLGDDETAPPADDETETDGPSDQFGLDSLLFVADEPEGFEQYTEQPDGTYTVGETVWIYVGVSSPPVAPDGSTTLTYTFEVETPPGDRWEPIERTEEWARVRDEELLVIWEGLSTFDDDPPGEYRVTVSAEVTASVAEIDDTVTVILETD